MKKHIFALILMLTVLLWTTSLAMTTDEFNKQAIWKTSRSTTVYRIASQMSVGPDDDPNSAYTLEEAGTIPAGTYLSSRQHSIGDKYEMAMMLNGHMVDYYVPNDAMCEAVRAVTLEGGQRVYIPELAYGDEAAVRTYLTNANQNEVIDAVLRAMKSSPAPQSSTNKKQSSSGSKTRSAAVAAVPAEWQVELVGEDGETAKAQLLQLGSYASRVQVDGEERTVPTLSLRFGADEAAPEQFVASVSTKSTGYVTLRSEPDQKAAALSKIPDGRLVGVLQPGDPFTLVACNGQTGYVLTRGLTFHSAAQEPLGEGILDQPGKAYTSIFLTPTRNARWLAKWKQGEAVMVILEQDGYYEVEKDGLRGWLKKAYVKLN